MNVKVKTGDGTNIMISAKAREDENFPGVPHFVVFLLLGGNR